VSAWLSIAVGASFVVLSAVELPERARRALDRGGTVLFAWTAVALATYIVLSFTAEGWLDGVPTDDRRIQYAIGLGSFALIAFATWRYAQAWLFARLPAQLAMVGALVLLAQVPPILVWGQVWHLSWWIYHATYGAAFAVLLTGWAVEARRAGSLRAIADALSMRADLAALNRVRARDRVPAPTRAERAPCPGARGPDARRRQDRRAGRDPPKAGPPLGAGVRRGAPTHRARPRHRRARPGDPRPGAGHPRAPRAARRQRLSRRPPRGRDPAAGADHRRRRQLRRDDVGAPVPAAALARRGRRGTAAGARHAARCRLRGGFPRRTVWRGTRSLTPPRRS